MPITSVRWSWLIKIVKGSLYVMIDINENDLPGMCHKNNWHTLDINPQKKPKCQTKRLTYKDPSKSSVMH